MSFPAGNKPEINLQLIHPDAFTYANFSKDALIEWMKNATNGFQDVLSVEKDSACAVVLCTLHKDAKPSFEIRTKPDSARLEKLLWAKLEGLPVLHSRYCDYSFLLQGSANDACPGLKEDCMPRVRLPIQGILDELKNQDLKGKRALIQKWALEEVLPILANSCMSAEDKFEGVRNFGAKLENLPQDYDPLELTDRNPDYWRAIMEMSQGNELITTAKIFLHVGRGEFDTAYRYLQTTKLFSSGEGVDGYYLSELAARLGLYYKELNSRVDVGVKKFDSGDIDGAAQIYTGILKEYPESSRVNHEMFLTKVAGKNPLGAKESREEWLRVSRIIYASDPMYSYTFQAVNGKEGYFLYRRMQVNDLFKDKKNVKADLLEYADIALDLGEYSLAANIYWHILPVYSGKGKGEKDLFPYFLYCVDKLGDHKVLTYFKDYSKEMKAVEDERISVMKKSEILYEV